MTRRLACIVAAALALALPACGGSEEEDTAAPAGTATPAATEEPGGGYGY